MAERECDKGQECCPAVTLRRLRSGRVQPCGDLAWPAGGGGDHVKVDQDTAQTMRDDA